MNTDNVSKAFRRQFTDYEAPYSVGAWEAFDKARGRDRKRRVVIWWSRLAACLLLLLVSAVTLIRWVTNEQKMNQHLAKHVSRQGNERPTGPEARETPPQATTFNPALAEPKSNATTESNPTDEQHQRKLIENEALFTYRRPARVKQINAITDTLKLATGSATPETKRSDQPLSQPDRLTVDPIAIRPLQLARIALMVPAVAYEAPTTTRRGSKFNSSVRLGVSLLPQSNYARANQPSVALGGGLSTEITLSKHLALVSGFAVTRQALGIQPDQPSLLTTYGIRQLVDARFAWWGLDVPLNLRYQFGKPGERTWFLTAGTSSVATFGQTYERQYETNQLITTSITLLNGQIQEVQRLVTTQETQAGESPASGTFQPARLLNASVGVDYRIGKQQFITVEPYLKYPLGEVTGEKLRYTTVGLQLRWMLTVRKQ